MKCLCGCNEKVKEGNKYINGHNSKGENNPNWKGGCNYFLHEKARELFGTDKCEECNKVNKDGSILHMHNTLNPKNYYIMKKSAWKCLCRKCHQKIEVTGRILTEEHKRKIGKSCSVSLKGHIVKESTRKKISNARKNNPQWFKKYIITYPNDKKEIIENLSYFCKENGLNVGHMSSCASGKLKKHKGFKCEYYER